MNSIGFSEVGDPTKVKAFLSILSDLMNKRTMVEGLDDYAIILFKQQFLFRVGTYIDGQRPMYYALMIGTHLPHNQDVVYRSLWYKDKNHTDLDALVARFYRENAFYLDLVPEKNLMTDEEVKVLFKEKMDIDLGKYV